MKFYTQGSNDPADEGMVSLQKQLQAALAADKKLRKFSLTTDVTVRLLQRGATVIRDRKRVTLLEEVDRVVIPAGTPIALFAQSGSSYTARRADSDPTRAFVERFDNGTERFQLKFNFGDMTVVRTPLHEHTGAPTGAYVLNLPNSIKHK